MPQTKKQEIVYTVMMVCVMVYGMVCYNIALDVGGMQNFIFAAALSELPIMGVIGFLLDTFLVGPTAMRIATGLVHPRQGQAGVPGGRYLLSVRVDDVPVDELFRHAVLQGQPQRELFRHVGADHSDELSHGIFVAAVRRGPAGAVRVWQGSGRYEKEAITIS